MKRIEISQVVNNPVLGTEVLIKGWVRTFRSNRFIAINDGSTINNIQAVVDFDNEDENELKRITTGASIHVVGELIESQGRGQSVELVVKSFKIIGDANPDEFPLQPKKHSLEYLREIAHLRPRTNTFAAVLRVRHAMTFAIHEFFNDKGFFNIHTPLITATDAEGAGEAFQVTTMDLKNVPLNEDGEVDYKQDFFAKETSLAVTGQLEAELAALALSKVYTFGPTFRAENSNTTRHLSEFWMIEPEVAFADNNDNMDLAEAMLKYCIDYALKNCEEDLTFLNSRILDEDKSKPQAERTGDLFEKLRFVSENDFERITYTEAIDILRNSKPNKKKKFNFLIDEWGADLQSEHERFLVEKHFKKPVIISDYPANIKAFYMKYLTTLQTL